MRTGIALGGFIILGGLFSWWTMANIALPQKHSAVVIPKSPRIQLREPVEENTSQLMSFASDLGLSKPTAQLEEDDEVSSLEVFKIRVASLDPNEFYSEFIQLLKLRVAKGDFGFDRNYRGSWPAATGQGDPFFKTLLTKWGEISPLEALSAIDDKNVTGKDWNVTNRYLDLVLQGWTGVDANAAYAWALNSVRTLATNSGTPMEAMFAQPRLAAVGDALVARGDFAIAADLFSGRDEYSGIYARSLADAWAKLDPSAAMAWVARIPPPRPLNDTAKGFVAVARTNGFSGLGANFGRTDPDEVLKMIGTMTNSTDRGAMALGTINSFLDKNDIVGGANWLFALGSNQPDLTGGSALAAFMSKVSQRSNSREELAALSRLADSIRDPNTRNSMYGRLGLPLNGSTLPER